jgi:hypothetical protein
MDNKSSKVAKSSSNPHKFFCQYCHYTTSKKCNWLKHIKTKKHIKKSLSNCYPSGKSKMDNKKVANRYFCECGKNYQFQSGLSKHKKKCVINMVIPVGNNLKKGTTLFSNLKKGTTLFEEKISKVEELEKMENLDNNSEITSLKEELSDIKTVLKQFITQSTENHTKLSSHLEAQINSTKGQQTIYNNCNNQNMTINVFLNEQCKDALNLTDFVQNIKVTLEDLQYTKDNGFVNGAAHIITKQLQDLEPTQRPIHCSDKKRLQFYVKDDDKWEKDVDNKKLDETIRDVKLKLPKSLTEWEKMNPSYKKDPKLMDEWMNIMAGISEGDTGSVLKDKLALKRKIATYIELKEAMAAEKK